MFGVEAINCLMKAMSVKGNVIILAGYPEQMDDSNGFCPAPRLSMTSGRVILPGKEPSFKWVFSMSRDIIHIVAA